MASKPHEGERNSAALGGGPASSGVIGPASSEISGVKPAVSVADAASRIRAGAPEVMRGAKDAAEAGLGRTEAQADITLNLDKLWIGLRYLNEHLSVKLDETFEQALKRPSGDGYVTAAVKLKVANQLSSAVFNEAVYRRVRALLTSNIEELDCKGGKTSSTLQMIESMKLMKGDLNTAMEWRRHIDRVEEMLKIVQTDEPREERSKKLAELLTENRGYDSTIRLLIKKSIGSVPTSVNRANGEFVVAAVDEMGKTTYQTLFDDEDRKELRELCRLGS